MTKKIALILLIIINLGIISCNVKSYKASSYYNLSLDYEKITSTKTGTPIDDKIQSNNLTSFTAVLEELINSQIIELYDKNIIPAGLPKSKDEYIDEINQLELKRQIAMDSILRNCGNYYYCTIQADDYQLHQSRERIKFLEHVLSRTH